MPFALSSRIQACDKPDPLRGRRRGRATERLVNVLRAAGITAETAAAWGGKAFARLAADASTLAEPEKIVPLVKSGKITGLEDWLALSGNKAQTLCALPASLVELHVSQQQTQCSGQYRWRCYSSSQPDNPFRNLAVVRHDGRPGDKTLSSIEVSSVGSSREGRQ